MSSGSRKVTLRNDNSSIAYFGEWTTVQAEAFDDNWGNYGPPFSPTLHSTITNSSFSLQYNGSAVNVVGSVNIENVSTNPNPTWQCFLDGTSLKGSPKLPDSSTGTKLNMWSMCLTGDPIPDGQHELIVNVISNGLPFYLDYIEYTASSDVSLENSLITIQNGDPAINYISGWTPLNGIADQTSDPNGLVNVTFIGIQLSWYGFIPDNESHSASSGEYSIDGGPSTPFILHGLSLTATEPLYNQLFFITPKLDMGTHILSVKYTGESGQTPLTLDFLIVANGSFPSLPASSNGNANETKPHVSDPSSSNNTGFSGSNKSSSDHPGIVGGVVGSVVGVAIIVFFVWFKFHRKRSQGNSLLVHGIMPFIRQPAATVSSTSQVSKGHTQDAPQPNVSSIEYTNPDSNSDSIHPAPGFAMSSSPSAPVTMSGPRLQPESSATALHTASSTIHTYSILVRHEDSGIRLPPTVVTQEIEIPPTYTEQ